MRNDGKCPIWGTPATFEPKMGDNECVNSPRAGGAYWISGTAIAILKQQNDVLRARLTTWLVDQRRRGQERPEVNSDTIELVMQHPPLPVYERADGLLMYLAQKSPVISSRVKWNPNNRGDPVFLEMLARSESTLTPSDAKSKDELFFLQKFLENQEWIKIEEPENHGLLTVTVKGYARLAELATKQINSSQGFVAMWFDDSMTEAYEKGIAPGIEDAGYKPLPINRKEHINKIDDEIIAEIRRSRFVVADFTHGDTGPRGGVYYEAGFAHGLNIPVFFTCRKDVLDKIHFDTRQYNHILWEQDKLDDLRKQLADRISAVIGDNPNKTPKAA